MLAERYREQAELPVLVRGGRGEEAGGEAVLLG
jgi:hypothetical protein